MGNMICNTCLRAMSAAMTTGGTSHTAHHKTFADLKTSVDAGCQPCSWLWNHYSDSSRALLLGTNYAYHRGSQNCLDAAADQISAPIAASSFATRIRIQPSKSPYAIEGVHWSVAIIGKSIGCSVPETTKLFWIQKEWGPPEHDLLSNYHPGATTSSDPCWQLASTWLVKCLTSHASCHQCWDSSFRPRRLLKIEPDCVTLRLIDSHEIQGSGPRYNTSSYRWQAEACFTLTQRSEPSLRKGVAIHSLPQAFKDAVIITLRAEVQFLWIDALCIMQDRGDTSDWSTQSSDMGDIFANSYLNISALAADHGGKSFFVDRNAGSIITGIFTLDLDDHEPGTGPGQFRLVPDLWFAEIESSALNRRGWVLRERLLSPRTLYFGCNQIWWECREYTAAESSPSGLHPLASKTTTKLSLMPNLPSIPMPSISSVSRPWVFETWSKVVKAYSACSVTVVNDKLMAIAGLAKVFRAKVKCEYVAGMWRDDLGWALRWHTTYSSSGTELFKYSKRSRVHLAPSWSWSSMDGFVHILESEGTTLLWWTVSNVSLRLASDDPLGHVLGGSLWLHCVLLKLHLTSEIIEDLLDMGVGFTTSIGRLSDTRHEKIFACVYWDDCLRENPATVPHVYCALASIHTRERDGSDDRHPETIHALLLQGVDGHDGTYSRCGWMSSLVEPEYRSSFRLLQGLYQQPSKNSLPCISFDGRFHTIKVI